MSSSSASKVRSFQVEPKVFETLPNLSVCIAVVRGINYNDEAKVQKCKSLLEEAWKAIPAKMAPFPNVQSHPKIALWRQAYTSMKIGKKFTSSIENLAKRAAKPDSSPRSINAVVDFYNYLSLKHLVPFGGFDLDSSSVCDAMELRFSRPGDEFTALDNKEGVAEHVPEGEICYASQNIIITRHINWKQSAQGLIESDSKNVVLMTEILVDDSACYDEIAGDLKREIVNVFGIEPEMMKVDKCNPSIKY